MLPDDEVIDRLTQLASMERISTAVLIAHLAEFDGRRLHLDLGCSSSFVYCTKYLHFSESAAYKRIRCARAVRRFPEVLDALSSGTLHLAGLCVLAPHLDADNWRTLIAFAAHRSQREISEFVADQFPPLAGPPRVRSLPPSGSLMLALPEVPTDSPREHGPPADEPGAEATIGPPEPSGTLDNAAGPPVSEPIHGSAIRRIVTPATLRPVGEGRYRISATLENATYEKLTEARSLLRHSIPDGDIARIIDRALTDLVIRLRRRKWAALGLPKVREARVPYEVTSPVLRRIPRPPAAGTPMFDTHTSLTTATCP
jgi:hypothetical protein